MNYYKIVSNPPKVGTIINTIQFVDKRRINRIQKLNRLFNLFCTLSKEKNLSLHSILALLYPNTYYPEEEIEKDFDLENRLNEITQEIIKTSFQLSTEFKYFNDFILESVRKNLENELVLPNRFKSQFFFESIEDCLKYYTEIRFRFSQTIIEVEFLEGNQAYKFDNNLLTTFHNHYRFDDFYNQAHDCLTNGSTENPLYEIVFQGKYKIVAHSQKL